MTKEKNMIKKLLFLFLLIPSICFGETYLSSGNSITMANDKLIAVDVNATITASTNQTQGNGALTAQVNEVSVVANTDDTVTLISAVAGVSIEVINNGANTLQIFPASGDDLGNGVDVASELEANETIKFVAYNDTNWKVDATTEIIHASIYDQDNTDVFAIDDAGTDAQAYHTNGLSVGDLIGWTFDAGGAGTSFPIASIADSSGFSGTQILVTTTGSHGLVAGDIITLSNISAGTNAGVYVVISSAAATTFEVASTDSTNATGTMDQAATLTADPSVAGSYYISWAASATSATNNETFDFQLSKNATPIVGTKVRRKFGTATDYGSFGGVGTIHISGGDKIILCVINDDSAGDITIRNLTIVLIRL